MTHCRILIEDGVLVEAHQFDPVKQKQTKNSIWPQRP